MKEACEAHTIENGRLLPHPAAEHMMIADFRRADQPCNRNGPSLFEQQTQQWELAQTFEKGAFCGKGDGEITIAWAPIPPAQETLFPLPEDDRPISERNVTSPL